MTEIAKIHTTDRQLYRRCRRKWDWSSAMRQGLVPTGPAATALWFGSGMHFVMEDYHGYQRYAENGALAFYCQQTKATRPDDWREWLELGDKIFGYYRLAWLPNRDDFKTVWKDGKPQVEVYFEVPVPGVAGAMYAGTFDRVVQDAYGRYFVVDYKFMKKMDTAKLDLDSQITAYCWAAQQLYGVDFEGVVYMQFRKEAPSEPAILKNGEYSMSKTQGITAGIFRAALRRDFQDPIMIPPKYIDYLNWLTMQEGEAGDALIRRDIVRRNQEQIASEAWKITAETEEMTDPMLALYPNPTKDCAWDCPFKEACVEFDAGGDWEAILADGFTKKPEINAWRNAIGPDPDETPFATF